MIKPNAPIRRLPRYLGILSFLLLRNFRFIYFWFLGTALFVDAFEAICLWSCILCGIFAMFIGLLGVIDVVRPVDEAFESLPLSYPQKYGKPQWIIDEAKPKSSDIYRVTSAGFTDQDFKPYLAQLAVRIGQPIKEIRQSSPASKVLELVLKKSDVPKLLKFDDLPFDKLGQGEFFVGMGDDDLQKLSLTQMIHMLVAEQTGGGKTTFLKQFIATILGYTRNAHVALIDMKSGIDFQGFMDLPNFELAKNLREAESTLNAVEALYEERKDYVLKKKKTRWSEIPVKDLANDESLKGKPIGPIIVIVDEMGELANQATKEECSSDLQKKVVKLACLSRFVGIHLVVGTQRPDKSTINMQAKDNLVTRICFAVNSVTASNLVIGSMMATTIGKNPGRAVFQLGGDKVLQTPLIDSSDVEKIVSSTKEKLSRLKYDAKILNPITVPEVKMPEIQS